MPAQMTDLDLTRREALRRILLLAGGAALPLPLGACRDRSEPTPAEAGAAPAAELAGAATEDEARLYAWVETLRGEGFGPGHASSDIGIPAARVGELAIGTPYQAFTLEAYLRAGGSPMRTEPLTLSLTRFDCVSLVEACLAIARLARRPDEPTWEAFGAEMERMRYRGGVRGTYVSRLHYFSEWLLDNERRGLVRRMGRELGATRDERPLRFMSSNPDSYPAMADPEVRRTIAEVERSLDGQARWVVPTARIPGIVDRLQTGDVLGFATSIRGLDVTHAAFAYRDAGGVLRVLHAPLSGGVVEITRSTVPEYVDAIRQATGILVARPSSG